MKDTSASIEYDQDNQTFHVAIAGQASQQFDTYEEAVQFCEDRNLTILDNATTFAAQLGELLGRWSEGLTDAEKVKVLPALGAITDPVWSENAQGIMDVLRAFSGCSDIIRFVEGENAQ